MRAISKSQSHYVQCTLRRGNTTTVGWIEERAAMVGVRVTLSSLDGVWRVVAAHRGVTLTAAELLEHQQLHRASLPSVQATGRMAQ